MGRSEQEVKMNNLFHLFEEDRMKKQEKEMYHDYVRAPFPKGDERWKDMFDIKRFKKAKLFMEFSDMMIGLILKQARKIN